MPVVYHASLYVNIISPKLPKQSISSNISNPIFHNGPLHLAFFGAQTGLILDLNPGWGCPGAGQAPGQSEIYLGAENGR